MNRAFTLTMLGLLSGCASNTCIDLCQQYELYLDECGYGWSTVFADEGWVTLDDCYDDHWEAGNSEQDSCTTEIFEVQSMECF